MDAGALRRQGLPRIRLGYEVADFGLYLLFFYDH